MELFWPCSPAAAQPQWVSRSKLNFRRRHLAHTNAPAVPATMARDAVCCQDMQRRYCQSSAPQAASPKNTPRLPARTRAPTALPPTRGSGIGRARPANIRFLGWAATGGCRCNRPVTPPADVPCLGASCRRLPLVKANWPPAFRFGSPGGEPFPHLPLPFRGQARTAAWVLAPLVPRAWLSPDGRPPPSKPTIRRSRGPPGDAGRGCRTTTSAASSDRRPSSPCRRRSRCRCIRNS